MAGLIHPLIWEVSAETLRRFRSLTVFELPPDLYEALAVALGKESDEGYVSVPQVALEQVIGWFAPDVAYVKRYRHEEQQKWTLGVHYLGEVDRATVVEDLLDAFQLWLSVSAPPDRDLSLDQRLLDAVREEGNWRPRQVDPTCEVAPGRCVKPQDGSLFDVVTQAVAQHLAGQTVVLDGRDCGRLVLSGIKEDPYRGRELILFPPQRSDDEWRPGYWTVVIRVAAVTSPESSRLRVVASVHIRNYRSVK
jgi:pPIWI_RE module N-terminal domain